MPLTRGLGISSLIFGMFAAGSPAWAEGPTKSECAAANETAQDLRIAGKLRAARRKLAICTADTCPGPIREDCAQRLQDAEVATPTITIEAVDSTGHDLTGVRVTMDGEPLVRQLGGTAIEVDPGEHHFVFQSEGFKTKMDSFVIREGERNRGLRVVLEPIAAPSEPTGASASSGGSTLRGLGIAFGAAGVAGLALGTVFGVVAKSTYNHAYQDECGSSTANCTPQGAEDGRTAYSQATVATAGFVIGAAFLAAGAAFYFTAPHEGGVAIGGTWTTGGAAMAVRGQW